MNLNMCGNYGNNDVSPQRSPHQDRCRPIKSVDLQDAQTGQHGGLTSQQHRLCHHHHHLHHAVLMDMRRIQERAEL